MVGQELSGLKTKKGEVDADTMKTLCRELLCFIEAREAKVVKGPTPTKEQIEELPGDFLLNAANLSGYNQPRYEKDYPEWVRKMNSLGSA